MCDIFHMMKRLTNGQHCGCVTMCPPISQIVDSTAVILVTHFWAAARINSEEPLWPQLLVFIASGYVFKLVVAALDTGPICLAVRYLRGYLGLAENEEATNS